MVRRILTGLFAAMIRAICAELGAAPRHIQSSSAGTSTALQAAPDLARMEQVIQSFVASKRFMGTVLVARDENKLLDKG
jgi:hypothetical protein